MYLYFGFLALVSVIVVVWLIRHPLVVVTLNAAPLAWWYFGLSGLVTALFLASVLGITYRSAGG